MLAGDVNLDGKVNALDLQASIAQLGTNPQAIGVMPLADLNNDNIVDTHDVVLLLQDYGEETDIYEGLWDGSRLLAVVGGSAGFGTIGGGGLAGNWGIEPGRRPADDCVPADVDLPPDIGQSLLPVLLRVDAARNCQPCPDYDDAPGCYTCFRDKKISGGSVSAAPSQPLINEPVTFTASGVQEIAGLLKCQDAPCGTDGKTEPTPLDEPIYHWAIYTKGPNGWPEESDPNDFWPSGTGSSITVPGGSACEEMKAVCWARPTGCISERPWKRIGDAEVKFASFSVSIKLAADNPPTHSTRRRIGIGEIIDFEIDQPNILANWEEIVPGEEPYTEPSQSVYTTQAPPVEPGQTITLTIRATANGCTRDFDFEVVPPSSIRTVRRASRDYHFSGIASAGFGFCVHILPEDVSFKYIQVGEASAYPSIITGNFSDESNPAVFTHTEWFAGIGPRNLVDPEYDFAHFRWPLSSGESYRDSVMVWNLAWRYCLGDPSTSPVYDFKSVTQMHFIDSNGTAAVNKFSEMVVFGLNHGSVNALLNGAPNYHLNPYTDCD